MALSDFAGLDPIPVVSFESIGINTMSRYRFVKVFREDGETFLGSFSLGDFPPSPLDVFHRISPGEVGNLPLLSSRYYGTHQLWWVIAFVNGVYNPLEGMVAGEMLRVPPSEAVFSRLARVV